MNFYYRSLPEGRCEVVCTRCFCTVGAAGNIDEIRRLEERHGCAVKRDAVSVPPLAQPADVPLMAHALSGPNALTAHSFLLLWAAALLLYVLPTVFELTVLRNWNPWIGVVIAGDIAGCFCLAVVFRKVRIGIGLYCVLTMIEAGFYWLRVTPPDMLLWVTDLVPTLVVFAIIWRSGARKAKLIPIG